MSVADTFLAERIEDMEEVTMMSALEESMLLDEVVGDPNIDPLEALFEDDRAGGPSIHTSAGPPAPAEAAETRLELKQARRVHHAELEAAGPGQVDLYLALRSADGQQTTDGPNAEGLQQRSHMSLNVLLQLACRKPNSRS